MANAVGSSANYVDTSALPIGRSGLAWSILNSRGEYEKDISHVWMSQYPTGDVLFGGSKFKLVIKKIGRIVAGASIPSGLLGYCSIHNEVNAIVFHTSNEASVGTVSCKTPDVVVKMGDQNRVKQFKGVGTSLAPVSFSIGLKECPEGINKVSYLLKPNTKIVDAARSVVELDAESTAKGVGLQILDEKSNPVALNEKIRHGWRKFQYSA